MYKYEACSSFKCIEPYFKANIECTLIVIVYCKWGYLGYQCNVHTCVQFQSIKVATFSLVRFCVVMNCANMHGFNCTKFGIKKLGNTFHFQLAF